MLALAEWSKVLIMSAAKCCYLTVPYTLGRGGRGARARCRPRPGRADISRLCATSVRADGLAIFCSRKDCSQGGGGYRMVFLGQVHVDRVVVALMPGPRRIGGSKVH